MWEAIKFFFDTSGFMPHGHCYLWSPALVSINVISDFFIFASYLAISLTLAYVVIKVKEIPFQKIWLAFGTFIVACGFTHFMEIINVWTPTYWLTGLVKIVTAIASLGTAIILPFVFPKIRDLARGAVLLRTQNALKESELLYRQIVDTANEGIWLLDLNGKTKFVNRRMADMLQYSSTEMVGRPVTDFVDEEGRVTLESFRSARCEGSHETLELALYPKSGSRIFVRILCNDLRDKDGSVIGSLGMLTDVTKQRMANEAIRASELHFRSLIESLPQLVWSSTRSGDRAYINQNLQESLGIDPERLHEELIERLHPLDKQLTQEAWEAAYRTEEPYVGEYRLRYRDGSYRWQLGRISPIRNPDGTIAMWVGISTDIDEQKAVQRVAFDAQSKLQAALHNMDAFLWAVDSQLIITTAEGNHPGPPYLKHEIRTGHSMLDYFDEKSDRIQSIREALKGRSVVYEKASFGNFREVRVNPLRDGKGRIIGVVGVSIDITERKKAAVREEAAIEASRLKSEFLANMSHEIRTPLNGVLGMLSLLATSELSYPQRELAENAKRSSEALLTVLNDILDFSKIEAGKLDFEQLDFDLHELIRESKKLIHYSAQEKGLTIAMEFDPSLPHFVKGDPGRLRQIFWNLLTNAIKFTEEGVIVLRATSLSHENGEYFLRFEVEDTGIGINESLQQRLFTAFMQADSSTTRKFGGTGLGLSIAKSLVERMKGSIGVESLPGFGSTFWFTVRLEEGQPPLEMDEDGEKEYKTSFPEAKVLVADDNLINRKVVLKFLEHFGYKTAEAKNGREALEVLDREKVDIILMDCHMPEIDGFECTRILRAKKTQVSRIPIVALTASAMKRDFDRCLDVGMNDFVAKPVRRSKLFEALETQLTLAYTQSLKVKDRSKLNETLT